LFVQKQKEDMIYNESQQELAAKIESGLNRSGWKDWKWQLRHAIRSLDKFEHLTDIRFEARERSSLERTFRKFPLSITPYYLSLIDRENYRNDPVFKQAFGSVHELNRMDDELEDPLSEEQDSPVEGITHRYPDRVLFHVSNICSMYCRHCTRKRKVGDVDFPAARGHPLHCPFTTGKGCAALGGGSPDAVR
jgi:lysine 2,3-aminomutase